MFKSALDITKNTFSSFLEDGCMQMSAALAYYTIFAIPGLLIIVISVASIAFEKQNVEEEVVYQVRLLLGNETAGTIRTAINHVQSQTTDTSLATLLGIGILLFGATGAFVELQTALNTIWGVKPNPEKGNIRKFIKSRLLSFGMILSIGFLLLVSLMLSTVLSILGKEVNKLLPDLVSIPLVNVSETVISIFVFALLFATLFKMLPDALITWKDVMIGAIATSLAFVIGKELIGIYLGNSNIGSAYGAASSLAVLLVWVYFSAVIIYLGAEFTQAWIRHSGRKIKASEGALLIP